MSSEQQGEPKKAPREVGRVDVEVVGVDDVSRGGIPTQPPRNDTSRVIAAAGWVLFPVALFALTLPEFASELFIRAHAMQALALWALIVIVFVIPCVGTALSIGGAAIAVYAAVQAWRGEYVRLPGIWQLVSRFM